jgi:chromosome segregation ATPase
MAIIAALSVQYSNFGINTFQAYCFLASSNALRNPELAETREWVNLLVQDANKDNYMSLKLELNPIAIEAVDGNPFDAIKAVKEFQQKLKATPMNQSEWKELNDALQQYWEKANKRIDEDRQRRKQEQERKSQETIQRQQERLSRLEFNIARFAELIVKNTNVVERIEEQLTKLKEEKESARSDEFKLKVQGWIDEKQARIDDIKRANTELEEKLSDMRNKLAGNPEN